MSFQMLDVSETVQLILAFSVVVFALNIWMARQGNNISLFMVDNRSVGLGIGTLSVSAAWIWAPALFVSSQKGYQQGVAGVFWFTIPNVLALVMFAFLAAKIREVMDQGYTLPEFIRHRLGKRSHFLHILAIFTSQTYAVIVQLTGSLLLLNLLTGISKFLLLLVIAFIFLTLALFRGIHTAIRMDTLKAIMITLVIAVIVPCTIAATGGFSVILQGLGGHTGLYGDVFDPSVAWSFGVPITISLLSGIAIDQQQWQRAFCIKRNKVRPTFLIGAVLFALVPLSLALLGFLAAAKNTDLNITNPQLAGVTVIAHFLPKAGLVAFATMVLAGLTAGGTSALCAASVVGGIDIYREYMNRDASDDQIIKASRIAMVLVLSVAMAVALLPNVQILYLQLLVGSFRSALLVPTILALFWRQLSSNAAFYGMLMGMVCGVPLFVYGTVVKNTNITSLGSLVPIVISTAVCVAVSRLSQEPFFCLEASESKACDHE